MRWMRSRLNQEEGFTLIELMVVVLIIAVLVAIAVPSFLGFRNRAQDRSAQADLRNVLVAEKAYWTDHGEYAVGATAEASLKEYEPSIVVDHATALADLTADDPVHVQGADDIVCMVATSDSSSTFIIFEDASATGGTFYGAYAGEGTAVCPANAAGVPADAHWATDGFPPVS